jgi:hypothetical protein
VTVLSSFEATGVLPVNPDQVLKHFKKETILKPSSLSESEWVCIECLLYSMVHMPTDKTIRLSHTLHHLEVENKLLNHESDGLQEVLSAKKKQKKKGKVADLHQSQEYHGGAVFWSPRKIREA